jgi:hypothetical protein
LCIEALAVQDAVVFASQQGFCIRVIETDCQELVKLWKERQIKRSLIAPIVSEIEDFLFFLIVLIFVLSVDLPMLLPMSVHGLHVNMV